MAIEKIRMPDGSEVIIDEWISIPRYSTIEFGDDVDVNLRAFTYVVGSRVPQQGTIPAAFTNRNATETDTNQTTRTRINHDQAYLAYSLTYEVFALDDATIPDGSPTGTLVAGAPVVAALNLRRLQRDLLISLTIGANIDKPQARFPFSWMGQGPGAPAYTSGDVVSAGVAFSYGTGGGRPSPKNQRSWRLPVWIASDRVFYVQVASKRSPRDATTPRHTQAIRLRLYIDGLNRRPIA